MPWGLATWVLALVTSERTAARNPVQMMIKAWKANRSQQEEGAHWYCSLHASHSTYKLMGG
jgi:hypothetical protein